MAALERGRKKLVGDTNRALDVEELDGLSKSAFKEAYDQYKKMPLGIKSRLPVIWNN